MVPISVSARKLNNFCPTKQIEDPVIQIVYSATDDDAQILISGGSTIPIEELEIVGPKRKVKYEAEFDDDGGVGLADFQFETPEPSLQAIQSAYPVGKYVFRAESVTGCMLTGVVDFSHELLPAPKFISPREGDVNVPINNLKVTWAPIEGAEAIRFEIEDEENEVALKVDLPGGATEFALPEGWLKNGVEYTVDIKARGENNNITVADIRFVTGSN